MAKSKKNVRSGAYRKSNIPYYILRLIPYPVQKFMARRFVDAMALMIVGFGLFSALSVLSYNRHDPSINHPDSSAVIHNLMGLWGAQWGDWYIQMMGYSAVIFSVIITILGIRFFRRLPFSLIFLRILSLFFGILFLSTALARVPSLGGIDNIYSGGTLGMLFLNRLVVRLQGLSINWLDHNIVAAFSFVLSVPFLSFAAFLRIAHWQFAVLILLSWGGAVVRAVRHTVEWLRHHNDVDAWAKIQERRAATVKLEIKPAKIEKKMRPAPVSKAEKAADGNMPAKPLKIISPVKSDMESTRQGRFTLSDGAWVFPPLELLQDVPDDVLKFTLDEGALRKNAEMLSTILEDFNVQGEIVSIHPGPVVTLYELEPAPGTKTSRVISLSDDLARSMSAVSVRAAVVPGRNVIGIELPNKNRQMVYLRDVLSSKAYEKTTAKLPLVLGKDIGGQPIIADLARMPHLLVAGTTGSGKSVAVNTMLLSLLYRLPPEKCRFIMIDPKMLELSVYDDIPHLLTPVVTEPGKAVVALKWAVAEMEDRYRAMSKLGVRNIDGYNERLKEAREKGEVLMRKVQTGFDSQTGKPVYEEQPLDLNELPYIVVIVDEFADLMLVAGKDVEAAIQRLAQMARAAGIHLIMATQRPSVDVITGVIKANFPTRISFQVTSKIDSRTILGEGGAEQLLGQGDMLYMASGGRIKRVHGPFVSDSNVEDVVKHLKSQGEPAYLDEITTGTTGGGSEVLDALFGGGGDGGQEVDELYDKAVAIVAREQKASTSFVQRYLQIGYNRAARIIEEMERQGVISPANAVGKRQVLVNHHGGSDEDDF